MRISKTKTFKVLLAIGTRPEAIKMAPLVHALRQDIRFQPLVCNTAQHRHMVDEVLTLFGIKADFDLNVMKPDQTIIHVQNAVTERFSEVLVQVQPDMVVVQGDTTTAFAAALTAFYHLTPVAHLEAGLRTQDKHNPFPEEVNRRMVAVVADIHFAPTPTAQEHLLREGFPKGFVPVVGNSVVDALHLMRKRLSNQRRKELAKKFPVFPESKLVLVTAHRRENWGQPLERLCDGVHRLLQGMDAVHVIWPVHPHPRVRSVVIPLMKTMARVQCCDPLQYDEFVYLLDQAAVVITDSGGIQEEAASLGKPVFVFRKTTERPEVLAAGIGELVPQGGAILARKVLHVLNDAEEYVRRSRSSRVFGDGRTSLKVCDRMARFLLSASKRAYKSAV